MEVNLYACDFSLKLAESSTIVLKEQLDGSNPRSQMGRG